MNPEDKLEDKEVAIVHVEGSEEPDQEYLDLGRFRKFWRSVHLQMILFGLLALAGPAMMDAINNLGGGGLKSPYLANLASSLNYATSCIMALFGGPVINKIGIKWACVISGACYCLGGTGYYVMARYGNEAYLLSARVSPTKPEHG